VRCSTAIRSRLTMSAGVRRNPLSHILKVLTGTCRNSAHDGCDDHRRFEELLKQGEETTERAAKRRRQLLDMLTREVNEHELMEEQVLYPALEPRAQAREIVLEGYEEHHVADVTTNELRDVTPDDERWAAKFKVLKESLEHHIKEEERNMFRTARAVLSRDELSELGARMKALKAESRR